MFFSHKHAAHSSNKGNVRAQSRLVRGKLLIPADGVYNSYIGIIMMAL